MVIGPLSESQCLLGRSLWLASIERLKDCNDIVPSRFRGKIELCDYEMAGIVE